MSTLESVRLPSDGYHFSLIGFLGGRRVIARSDGRVVRIARLLYVRALDHLDPTTCTLEGPRDSTGSSMKVDTSICWLVACIRAIDRIVVCEMQDPVGRARLSYGHGKFLRSSRHLPFTTDESGGRAPLS